MRLRIKSFNIIGGPLKNQIFRGGLPEKPIYREKMPKKGGLVQFPDLRGELGKKRGGG